MVTAVRIGSRPVGAGHPCFVIAEAGVNHDGQLELARQLVDAAVSAGADAVKFQTFDPDQLATAEAPKAAYQVRAGSDFESQLEMLRKLTLSKDDHEALAGYCESRRILFLSTPFDDGSADLLYAMGLAAFKISSGDLTNLPFLERVAGFGRPVLLSTGMATESEVADAVTAIGRTGNTELALLHCVSNYPARPADVNLRAMDTLAKRFSVPVGFSDHTMGLDVALAAVALGACVLEKHLTLDRRRPGPDHQASLEPHEFAQLMLGVRHIEAAMGHGRKEPAASELEVARVARKSVVAAQDLPAGTVLTDALLAVRRPGTGLPPSQRRALIGRRTARAIAAGALLAEDMLA